ncbi:MAG: hypothetical protein HKO53_01750, partial [Gemmatimonadetes bacterium]|nr:hypothetical protein [Gemmatimonadota bacterium]
MAPHRDWPERSPTDRTQFSHKSSRPSMSKHICVTVDGSSLSLHALPVAGAIAEPGDVVELVTAVDPVPPFPVPGYAEAAARWVKKRHEEVKPL